MLNAQDRIAVSENPSKCPKHTLMERLQTRTATIGVVGLGYVGLPLALRFAESGFRVTGFDVDEAKIAALKGETSYIAHIPSAAISKAVLAGFESTSEFRRAGELDALILCVPTPLNRFREPDLSFVIGTVEQLAPYLRPGQVVSLESTTYPGTTEEELRPRIEACRLKVGRDIFLVYSPEREDPGNRDFTTRTIPKICGGSSEACLEVGLALYGSIIDRVVPVSSTRAAEMTKLLENIHRAVNIGLVNEMKVVADRMGIDIYEVIRAASTKPFGFVPYSPGPGLGGHCIPIDPFYLTWKAREYGVHTRFIELAGEVNSSMPDYVISKVVAALNREGKAAKGSKVLVLGIAYKKNVDDMRESPSLVLIQKLKELGAEVDYSDPYVAVIPNLRAHNIKMTSTPLTDEALASYDCALLATDHDCFDYAQIERHAHLIVDARGRFLAKSSHIVHA
jgi:UDP-N-acetyl-D-glucosamine dehydrogenase